MLENKKWWLPARSSYDNSTPSNIQQRKIFQNIWKYLFAFSPQFKLRRKSASVKLAPTQIGLGDFV